MLLTVLRISFGKNISYKTTSYFGLNFALSLCSGKVDLSTTQVVVVQRINNMTWTIA